MKRISLLSSLLLVTALLSTSLAAYNSELAYFLEEELSKLEEPESSPSTDSDRSLETDLGDHSPACFNQSQTNEDWLLRNFWIRLRAKVGVSITGIANVDLVPDAEILWQRPLPKGWSNYQPTPE